jgi:hypothetical protein
MENLKKATMVLVAFYQSFSLLPQFNKLLLKNGSLKKLANGSLEVFSL